MELLSPTRSPKEPVEQKNNSMKKLITVLLVAAFAATTTLPVRAADKPAVTQKKETKPRALPFQGKLDSVDQQAKTIKIGERVFHVTSDTKITKAGNPATLADAKAGDQVGLSYREVDKTLNLVSLRIGPKADAKK
jgi:hypothetical protein